MSHLPQDIIDCFIDEFHDSVKELKNLSLVGRLWLHRARYHLFRYLILRPQDLQAIRRAYANVKRKASLEYIVDPHDYMSEQDREFLHSPLAENPQPTQSFLTSITSALPYVRGLQLASSIRCGPQRLPVKKYFRDWLGYTSGDDYGSQCRPRWTNEDFRERQKARWDAVDLPWGPGAGLHALPFRNLRFIYIPWNVFSWTPPSEHGLTNSYNWPSYQLAMLIKSNADTLDHIYIDEYPGFQLEKYGSSSIGDALLDLLAKNAPKLRSLSLGGLREPFYPHLHISKPQGSDDFLSDSPALYPSGEIVPHVMTDDNRLLENSSKSSLERLFIQGFDSESTILIEDAFLNRDVFSLGSLRYLALSLMPVNYNYAFILSKVQGSLTHLTLDLDKSTLHLNLKFSMFPQLECLQLRIYSTYYTWTNLFNIVRSLSDDMYSLDEPGLMPPVQQVKLLNVSFGPSIFADIVLDYLITASIDDMLKDLVSPLSVLSGSMGRPQVDMITMEIPETVLAEGLPLTFQTGHLKHGKTDQWWFRPVYLQ